MMHRFYTLAVIQDHEFRISTETVDYVEPLAPDQGIAIS
jgi:hypothetical protein